jgi:Ala-tRNA(Pro) deacylase
MVSSKLKEHLDMEGTVYTRHVHPPAYTAQEVAAATHVPGRELVKSTILIADDQLVMAVLSANDAANLDILRNQIGCEVLRLATETEFADAFPSCKLGAMPPFGNLFGLPTYCETTLAKNREIEFNAGTHDETIRMDFGDFKRLVDPYMVQFAQPYREGLQRLAA